MRGRLLAQAGILGLLAASLSTSPVERTASAQDPECIEEGECTFKKPVFVILMDYSTSTNTPFGDPMDNITRWEAMVGTVQNIVTADNEFLSQTMRLGVILFGHDPDPQNPDTPIPGDGAGLIDGQRVLELWYDPQAPKEPYKQCQGDDIITAVGGLPAPLDGNLTGIESWTHGALELSRALMETGYTAHPEDAPSMDDRRYLQLVMTDGAWTNPDGQGQDPMHDPDVTAGEMAQSGIFNGAELLPVPTYVVYFGDQGGAGEADAHSLAGAGGTENAMLASDQMELLGAVNTVIQDIKDEVIQPNCMGGLPRVMVLLDASSSMLNTPGDALPAPEDGSPWDVVRYALAGDPYDSNVSLFDVEMLDEMMQPIGTPEQHFYVGVSVFGDDAPDPGEQRVLVQYAPCAQQSLYWALSPHVSHPDCGPYNYAALQGWNLPINQIVKGGSCPDPWQGPPIAWSFPSVVDGHPAPWDEPPGPGFDIDTYAHMPRCDEQPNVEACTGSGRFSYLGLELLEANHAAYHPASVMQGEANDSTVYVNVLITGGLYDGYSTDAQVMAPLQSMYGNSIVTRVIGVGAEVGDPAFQAQLAAMAGWGSGGTLPHHEAETQAALELALSAVANDVTLDPCCQYNDCPSTQVPPTCQDDLDCGLGNHCEIVDPMVPEGFCIDGPPDPEICEEDDDCEPGLECVKPDPNAPFGECEPPCNSDADCDPGEVCEPGGCVCDIETQPCGDECSVPEDCERLFNDPTLICVGGECTHCESDNECAGALLCVDGVCVPPPCTSDSECPDDQVCSEDGVCEPGPGVGSDTSSGSSSGGDTSDDGSAGPTGGNGSTSSSTSDSETTAVDLGEQGCACALPSGRGGGAPPAAWLGLGLFGLASRRRRARRAQAC